MYDNYMELNYVDMPDAYCRLLAVDMTSTSKHHIGLQNYILSKPSLKGITSRIFSRGADLDINSQIKTLGWYGVRDRLMAYYIHFAVTNKHTKQVDVDNIEDILHMEKALRFSTVSGYSRVMLLLFYMKLDNLESSEHQLSKHPLYPSEKVISILKLTNKRTVKIDYLIILIHHLLEYFGEIELLDFIKEGVPFHTLYEQMDAHQIEKLTENFLAYSASIDDSEIFVTTRI